LTGELPVIKWGKKSPVRERKVGSGWKVMKKRGAKTNEAPIAKRLWQTRKIKKVTHLRRVPSGRNFGGTTIDEGETSVLTKRNWHLKRGGITWPETERGQPQSNEEMQTLIRRKHSKTISIIHKRERPSRALTGIVHWPNKGGGNERYICGVTKLGSPGKNRYPLKSFQRRATRFTGV